MKVTKSQVHKRYKNTYFIKSIYYMLGVFSLTAVLCDFVTLPPKRSTVLGFKSQNGFVLM